VGGDGLQRKGRLRVLAGGLCAHAISGGCSGGCSRDHARDRDELGAALDETTRRQDVDESTVEDKGEDHPDDEAEDEGEMLQEFAEMSRSVSKMPKKEHDAALHMVKTIDDSKDGDSAADVVCEVAQEAPIQTAVYMSRVQRAKQANAARVHAK